MDVRMLASDPCRALSWLAGRDNGWAEVDRTLRGVRCMLCLRKINAQTMLDHGMAHLAATQVEFAAMATLVSLIADEKGIENYTETRGRHSVINEAVDQVFGFRPGTPEAVKFWQQHGEQK